MKKYSNILWVILAGIIVGLSVYHILYWLIWIALIPFFIVISQHGLKQNILYGFIYGVVSGSILLFWIINSTQKYSGSDTLLGIPLYILFVLYYAIFPLLFTASYSFVKSRVKNNINLVVASAFLWIVIEWINVNVLPGIPWVKYTLGFTQSTSLLGIQLCSVTGQWGISFVIVVVSMLFTHAITTKEAKPAFTGISLIIVFYLAGFVLLELNSSQGTNEIKVAILQENIKAETRWQESTGDSLANVFFKLNEEAAKSNPDLIVWSESALPWTFTPDDDLIRMALEITKPSNAGHIIGILSEAGNNPGKVYNSVYYFEPDGRATSRYDKMGLLSFLEKPFLNPSFKIPFLSEGVYNNVLEGSKVSLLKSPVGKIGMLLCNESLPPYLARKEVEMGADFLVNMSNDAWFQGTHLIDHHFYYARLKTVESGRSLIVNSNNGIAGFIEAYGVIKEQNQSGKATCIVGTISVSRAETVYYLFGDWVVFLCMIVFPLILFVKKNADKLKNRK